MPNLAEALWPAFAGTLRGGHVELNGRVGIVTGAAVGTGRAVAVALARRGCDVIVNYSKSAAEAEATAGACRELGVRALAIQADVADDGAVRAMVARCVAELGRVDVLVNNAGTTAFIAHDDMESVTDAVWERVFGVNLKGPFHCIRAALPELRRTGGAIVNVSSVAGVYAIGSSLPYIASKGALNLMTVALARALAPEVRVNCVAPGFVDTRWWQETPIYEHVKSMALEKSLVKKVCTPDDVARLIIEFACNDLVTGQVLVVDGGMGIPR